MTGLLTGKVAVVTGGASGIGRSIALAFAREGASAVVIADLRVEPREGGAPTTEELAGLGVAAVHVPTDVAVPAQIDAAVNAAEEFGGVDIMVNNAGVFRRTALLEATEDDFDLMHDVNVRGTFFGAQAAARAMVARGRGGVILNLSSVAGIRGHAGFGLYHSSKAAVRLLSYSMADELGPYGIRVLALHPGTIRTAMTTVDVSTAGGGAALQRDGVPEDVAAVAVFAASDLARYVSGTSLVVDGGAGRVM